MAYDANKPADNDFLADFPPQMREQLRSIIQDAIVNSGLLQGKSAGNGSGQIPVSNGVLNTGLNAERVGGLLASAFAVIAHVHSVATSSSNGFMSNTDFAKLAAIAAGAQVNQNAFSNISVNGVTVQADSPTDTLEVVAGTNIALTPDATNDRLTISVTGKVASATAADTSAACTGNAATATRWNTARTLTLGGDCTGSVSIDGSGNMTLTVVIVDDSHNHVIANVDGLQTALDGKLAETATAANASKVGNFSPATTSTVSTAAIRDTSGDLVARLFRTEYASGGGNCAYILGQNAIGAGTDNYARPIPLATLKAALGIDSIVGGRVWVSSEYTPVQNTPTIVNHGIAGLNPLYARGEVLLKCVVAEGGYDVGDYAIGLIASSAGNSRGIDPALSATTIQYNTVGTLVAIHKTNPSSAATITLANWRYIFRIWY